MNALSHMFLPRWLLLAVILVLALIALGHVRYRSEQGTTYVEIDTARIREEATDLYDQYQSWRRIP